MNTDETINRRTYHTNVLIIGSGAAGMMAARAAADEGMSVILADKSLIGRGGATILAQMTVAVALGEAEDDHADIHASDTLKGGRGLCDPQIVRTVVERGPEVILEVEKYGVGWARAADGKHAQVVSPGHSRKRCVYVDILNTGGATSAGLRKAIWRNKAIERLKNVMITKLIVEDGVAVGAAGFSMEDLTPVGISADSVIIAAGGLTEIYARNSASANMTGDGYILAAQAGAELRDMEMVQFFPIAHLYPPLVGIDPIMWDPFRYKLGGRLLNGEHEEFMDRYNGEQSGVYTATRDQTTYAIFQEVKAGRGSAHGGAYLDFRAVPEQKLKEAFGPVIDILASQNVDLTKDLVEVAPMAHFMLGGIRVNPRMETSVPGLYACGEAIYGMHGANRLSGNAITEALVTGRIAGEQAAARCRALSDAAAGAGSGTAGSARSNAAEGSDTVGSGRSDLPHAAVSRGLLAEWERLQALWHPRATDKDEISMLSIRRRMQQIMWDGAGPLRTEDKLVAALAAIRALREECEQAALAKSSGYALPLVEKIEACNMLSLSEAILLGAMARKESRGAHVRLDYPQQNDQAVSSRFKLNRAAAADSAVVGLGQMEQHAAWDVEQLPLPAMSAEERGR